MLRPAALLHLYLARLRVDAIAELFAFLGVTVAVALVFAVTVADSSITGSAGKVTRAVVGPADLQIHARSPRGFSQQLLERVERMDSVAQAAPILEQQATVTARNGRRANVLIAGTDLSLATLDGLAHTLPIGTLAPGGIGISRATARTLGVRAEGNRGGNVQLVIRGRRSNQRVSAVLGTEAAGALSEARIAVMPLPALQRRAGLPRQISRILVRSKPGDHAQAQRELRALANGRLTVAPANHDLAVLRQALRPSGQASALFAGLSALLGFLLAFNAMLLTVPERRRAITDLRYQGANNGTIVQILISQAGVLGVLASLAGLLVGMLLSSGILHQSPGYLMIAFTLGTGTVVGSLPVILALGGGILATCLVALVPLSDLRHRASDPRTARSADSLKTSVWVRLATCTAALVLAATVLFAAVPNAALGACVLLAVATILAVQPALAVTLKAAEALAERVPRLTTLPLALGSLRAASLRSIALAATGAVALFGSVALGSSRTDLLRGIDNYTAHYVSAANIWIVNPKDNQATEEIDPAQTREIAAVSGVSSIQPFQGSFLDFGDRRIWVIAWPTQRPATLLDEQLVTGNASRVEDELQNGAIAVSAQIADEHHAHTGGFLVLPTPTGNHSFRVAATTTNFGWSPGAVLMSTAAYTRAWDSTAPSALGVTLKPTASPTVVSAAIQQRLGPTSGTDILTARERETAIDSSAREGLRQLADIAWMLTGAAVLAMTAALGAAIAQRRASLAALRIEGARPGDLRRVLLIEAAVMLGAGCIPGALAGFYGQVVIDGYLKHVTGFPVAGAVTGWRPVLISAIVIALVFALMVLPGWWASRVSPALAAQDSAAPGI